jgi:hypothetical protein
LEVGEEVDASLAAAVELEAEGDDLIGGDGKGGGVGGPLAVLKAVLEGVPGSGVIVDAETPEGGSR